MIIPRYYDMVYMFYIEQFAIRLNKIHKDICHMAASLLSEDNHLYTVLDIKMLARLACLFLVK